MKSANLLIALLVVVCALGCCYAAPADSDDWDDDSNAAMMDNDQIPMLFDSFMTRELANSFISNGDHEQELYKRLFGSSSKDKTTTAATTTTKKSKHDPEEIREIEAKANARRRKAYKNYEDACKVHGKFTVRTCPKIEDCFARNKLKFIPVIEKPTTTVPPKTTPLYTHKPGRRELLDPQEALRFLEERGLVEDDSDDFDDDDDDSDSGDFFKRMLFSKNASKELQEETKERKQKAFKKYEEYCEKRKFRIGAERNCPPLKSDLC